MGFYPESLLRGWVNLPSICTCVFLAVGGEWWGCITYIVHHSASICFLRRVWQIGIFCRTTCWSCLIQLLGVSLALCWLIIWSCVSCQSPVTVTPKNNWKSQPVVGVNHMFYVSCIVWSHQVSSLCHCWFYPILSVPDVIWICQVPHVSTYLPNKRAISSVKYLSPCNFLIFSQHLHLLRCWITCTSWSASRWSKSG